MKRMHVSINVESLEASVDFYTRFFDAPPTLQRKGYAKWMLDDPRLNISLVEHGTEHGVNHLGIELESDQELETARRHLKTVGHAMAHQNNLTCGYQTQDKSWIYDPNGIAWEHFYTYAVTDHYGANTQDDPDRVALKAAAKSE